MKSFLDQIDMGIGTWAWGDRSVWAYGSQYGPGDIQEAFQTGLNEGIRFFDTAEVYGSGKSESFLGEYLKSNASTKIYIATKFAPWPWRANLSSLPKALRASLQRLGLSSVDLYQMHWPSPPRSIKAWMEPLAEAVKEGLVKEVGVSNYGKDAMRRAQDALGKYGVPLASNQVQYSLVRRKNELNGLLEECRKSNVRFIAYSPLGMGLLSGKYSSQNPPSGPRRLFFLRQLKAIQILVEKLKSIGYSHEGKTPNQVALNWLLAKGTLPIPGAKNSAQARENAGGLGWKLSDPEIAQLDEASRQFKG
jgi:aryl-alcohol dehydrogenase-like predicted oxidoreductase